MDLTTSDKLMKTMSIRTTLARTTLDTLSRTPFWSAFEHSRVPMCLVDGSGLVVASTDAAYELFGSSSEESIGTYAGRQIVDEDPALRERLWQQLADTNELYAETVVRHGDGQLVRVSYAGHGTVIEGRWHALLVVLSVRSEADGHELISTDNGQSLHGPESTLTPRERDVIRLVAQGSTSRQIATELGVSADTVRTHIRNAMAKTHARTRAQLVAIVLSDRFTGQSPELPDVRM